jgi:hypothetical protein
MVNAPRTVKDVPAQEFVVALAQYFRSTVRFPPPRASQEFRGGQRLDGGGKVGAKKRGCGVGRSLGVHVPRERLLANAAGPRIASHTG